MMDDGWRKKTLIFIIHRFSSVSLSVSGFDVVGISMPVLTMPCRAQGDAANLVQAEVGRR